VQKRHDRGGQPYKLGERVPYVLVYMQGQDAMTGKRKKPAQRDLVEDPEYAQEKGLLPHAEYYLLHQAEKPLTRIIDTALGEGATRRILLTPDVVSIATAPVRETESFWGEFKRAAVADLGDDPHVIVNDEVMIPAPSQQPPEEPPHPAVVNVGERIANWKKRCATKQSSLDSFVAKQ